MTVTHILFPFDFSAQGEEAAPFVRALANTFGAKTTLLSVIPPAFDAMPAGVASRTSGDPAQWVGTLQSHLDNALTEKLAGLRVDRVVDTGDPAFTITRFARNHDVDLIMMPTHGLGLFRTMLLGSVTSKVLHDATCPVWTAAHAETQTATDLPKTVLCAVDGTPETPALVQWAAEFSAKMGARLNLLHVVGPITDWPSLARERRLQDAIREEAHATISSMVKSAGVDLPLRVAVGEIVPTVTEEASQAGADLVIVGRGSVAEPFGRLRTHAFGIIQRSLCPVLSV